MLSRSNKSLNFSLENCVINGITYLVSNMPVSELQNIYAEIVRKLNFLTENFLRKITFINMRNKLNYFTVVFRNRKAIYGFIDLATNKATR